MKFDTISQFWKAAALACLFFHSILLGEIITSSTLEPLEKELEVADNKLLVLFDVDDTLLYRLDSLYHPENRKELKTLWSKWEEKVGIKKAEELKSRVFLTQGVEIVDKNVLSLIACLKEKGALCLGLTALSTGAYGEIPSLENWRKKQLNSFGFSFSLQNLPRMEFKELETKGMIPIFQNGVIYSAKTGKGPTLLAFLKKADLYPKRIVFLDDELLNLQSVEKAVASLEGVSVLCIHYTAAYEIPVTLDAKREERQLEVLFEEGVWKEDSDPSLRDNFTTEQREVGLVR